MTARMTYLVCRKAPDRPEGVIYWDGTHRIEKNRRATVVVGDPVMFRADAWDGDEAAAQLVAGVLTELGPSAGLPGAPKWEVLPATIEMTEKAAAKGLSLGDTAEIINKGVNAEYLAPSLRARLFGIETHAERLDAAALKAFESIVDAGNARTCVERLVEKTFPDPEEGWVKALFFLQLAFSDSGSARASLGGGMPCA